MYSLPIGTKLKSQSEYTITAAVGQGGFGITYLASADFKFGNITATAHFAIKEFFLKGKCKRADDGITLMPLDAPLLPEIEDCLHDFITEGERINKLCRADEHIVNVNEVFRANNTAYFVMEYIGGGSLVDLVHKKGVLSAAEAKAIIIPIANAIGKLHEANVLHLDIKPENIMMKKTDDEEIFPVIIDFGISMHFGKDGKATTRSKNGAVSDGYSPVEQYGHVTSFAPQVDVYALGATMFYMLTGKTPQQAFDVTTDYLERSLNGIDEAVKYAVMHAMAKDYATRTETIEVFVQELNGKREEVKPVKVTEEVNTDPKKPGGDTVRISTDNGSSLSKYIKLGVIGVLAFIGVIVGYNLLMPSTSDNQEVKAGVGDTIPKKQIEHVAGQTFKDTQGNDFSYTGEVVDGKPNGKGTGIYPYGTYTGEYRDGLRHGANGTFESKDGSNKFVGSFVNDLYENGKLTMTADGSYFEGSFNKGKPYNGKWYSKDGSFTSDLVEGEYVTDIKAD